MATFVYKATDVFTGIEFPAMSLNGKLYDSTTGDRVTRETHPMGVITKQINTEEHAAMCDALGIE